MYELNEQAEEAVILKTLLNYLNQNVFVEQHATLERFAPSLPAICIRGEKGLDKGKANILGEYIALFPFVLSIRIAASDHPQSAYLMFETLNAFLEQARGKNDYPDLLRNRICLDITMTSCPVLEKKNEDGSEEYLAVFTVKYRKTPKYY